MVQMIAGLAWEFNSDHRSLVIVLIPSYFLTLFCDAMPPRIRVRVSISCMVISIYNIYYSIRCIFSHTHNTDICILYIYVYAICCVITCSCMGHSGCSLTISLSSLTGSRLTHRRPPWDTFISSLALLQVLGWWTPPSSSLKTSIAAWDISRVSPSYTVRWKLVKCSSRERILSSLRG